MKLIRLRLLFFALVQLFFCTNIVATGNNFFAVAQDHINNIVKKKSLRQGENKEQISHKSPIEFKQAVARYIKHTDIYSVHGSQRQVDENVSYKKELRYLFKNYGKFSTATLLSRLRSAHQEMVKGETDIYSESYKRYEQVSSALLLVCVQVFAHDVRNQILNALDEIDNLIVYWRHEQQCQINNLFSKPSKAINNLKRLERKQRELYTILGALSEHVYAFSDRNMTYNECYTWIEELFGVLSCVQNTLHYNGDESRFDQIAAQLEAKIKRVGSIKNDCLASITAARKPNHFARNWGKYAIVMAATGYLAHYHQNNPEVLPDACIRTALFVQSVAKSVVIDPLTDLYQVFFKIDSKSSISNIEKRVVQIEKLANALESNVAKLTEEGTISLREYAVEILKEVLERMKIENRNNILKDIANNDLTTLNTLCGKTSYYYYDNRLDMQEVRILLVVNKLLKILQDYPELIDNSILPLIKEAGLLIVDSGNIVGDFVKNNFWTAKLVAFTPLAAACIGSVKAYRWAIKKDYAPIRIALADVNALLIESAAQLDNYQYGKLVYLICKLRHKANSLKDVLADEFLADVAKLESKRYTPAIKQDIVDNMFNKYAFLGRIAV